MSIIDAWLESRIGAKIAARIQGPLTRMKRRTSEGIPPAEERPVFDPIHQWLEAYGEKGARVPGGAQETTSPMPGATTSLVEAVISPGPSITREGSRFRLRR